jgi:hypothetical protein
MIPIALAIGFGLIFTGLAIAAATIFLLSATQNDDLWVD